VQKMQGARFMEITDVDTILLEQIDAKDLVPRYREVAKLHNMSAVFVRAHVAIHTTKHATLPPRLR